MKKIPTVLVIDDDEINIFIISKIIEKIGYEVDFVAKSDGELAIEYIKNLYDIEHQVPDVVLIDINMPVMDGWEFLNEYDKLCINLPADVYILSSSIYENDIKRANSFKFVKGFLSKPLSRETLIELLSPATAQSTE